MWGEDRKPEPWVGWRAGSGATVPGLAALTLRRWLSTLARPALGLGALAMGVRWDQGGAEPSPGQQEAWTRDGRPLMGGALPLPVPVG